MKKKSFRIVVLLVFSCMASLQAMAQGIVVNKTDGTKVYYKASEVESVSVYDYGEGPESETPEGYVFTVNGVSFTMVDVEGDMFYMGSVSGETDERPMHVVNLHSFSIGQTEVTQELWEAVMGKNPSETQGGKHPVEMVSWNDCQKFITKLNQLTGKNFRLPTEAEWEYAARGGNKSRNYTYSGSNTIDDVGWCYPNSDGTTHEVATKAPNELGIYDMSGNVWEWCQDFYDSNYYYSTTVSNPTGPTSGPLRVYRGGSYTHYDVRSRVSTRENESAARACSYIGLRLAL